MKKLLVFGLLSIFISIDNVSALEVNNDATLKACLEGEENECVVTDNINLSQSINIKGSKTLDLNDHIVTLEGNSQIQVTNHNNNQGNLTIVDSGEKGTIKSANGAAVYVYYGGVANIKDATIESDNQAVSVWGYEDETEEKTIVTIGKDVTINTKAYGAVVFWDTKNGSFGTELNVYGTINVTEPSGAGITVNGNVNKKGENVPVIRIYDSAIINNEYDVALYGAGYAKWYINGGTFTGYDALNVKSGVYYITGGTFTGNGEFVEIPNGSTNGAEQTGSAINITSNNSYAGDVELYIDGGTYISEKGYSLYQNITDGSTNSLEKIKITQGKFTGQKGVMKISSKDEIQNFILGGTFSSDVDSSYLDPSVKLEEVNGEFVVKNVQDSTVNDNITDNVQNPSNTDNPNTYDNIVIIYITLIISTIIVSIAFKKIYTLCKNL